MWKVKNYSSLNRCAVWRGSKCHSWLKDRVDKEKQDFPKLGSQSFTDGVAMGTGVSTHMEVKECGKLCPCVLNGRTIESPFCLYQRWRALKNHKCKCPFSRSKVRVMCDREGFGWIVIVLLLITLALVSVCVVRGTFSPSLHDTFSTCVDGSVPPGTFLSICTYTAATAPHVWPKHPPNTNCCQDETETKPKPEGMFGEVFEKNQ